VSTAQDLPVPYGEPLAAPALRLVPSVPLDFDEAVRRIRPRLHRYAYRRLGDLHEAEELVQEALLRAYSHRAQLLTEDDLAAWTTVVTGRLVIDRLRVRGRSTSMADVPETSRVGRDTADVVVARDEARLALDALDAMHPRQAALLWAREVEGQSYEDLCVRFAMTEPAVRSVLTRARKALRKEYGARGGTLPVGGLAVLAPWVAGLGWADKLRRVATRLSAPAALSAVGITALGGLVLSPFGLVPAPGTSTFHPSQAVVSTFHLERPFHAPALAGSTVVRSSRSGAQTPVTRSHSLPAQVHHAVGTCVNDTDRDDGNNSIDLTAATNVLPGLQPTAGSGDCDAAESTPGTDVTVHAPHPLEGQDLTVTVPDKLSCPTLPSNQVATCDSTQSGAPS
jgi:RNA polymerase sigma-70 factor (ECF subfamily)